MSEDGPGPKDAHLLDAPLLDEVMPWSVAPMRLGREWVLAPDPAWLQRRWDLLRDTEEETARAALFGPSRSRDLHSMPAPLPGSPSHDGPLARESGRCPEPVRVLHGPYDQQWLIPDHRLIDGARPQLWRVGDDQQTHLVETAHDPRRPGPLVTFTTLLPDGHCAAGRPGRIRPLHRRRGGREPNLLPGLTEHLATRLGVSVNAEDVLAWIAATVGAGPNGRAVPLTSDAVLWRRGVALGRRVIRLHTRGARFGDGAGGGRPRLPGGRRPYVRAPLPSRPAPGDLGHDLEERSLHIGEGRVAPVERAAWEFEAGGERVLERWFAQRADPAVPGTLAAVRPRLWHQEWTTELLELITVLTLLAELRPEQRDLADQLGGAGPSASIGREGLKSAGILPPPSAARRPASVLDLREEGPGGQLALL